MPQKLKILAPSSNFDTIQKNASKMTFSNFSDTKAWKNRNEEQNLLKLPTYLLNGEVFRLNNFRPRSKRLLWGEADHDEDDNR